MKLNDSVLSIVRNEFKNDNRVLNQAISLSNNEYQVTVLAIQRDTILAPEEMRGGVKVIRIKNTFKKIDKIRYVRGLYFKLIIFFKVANLLFKNKYHFIHCHDLNTLHIGLLAKIFSNHKVKLLYDAHEHETERNLLFGFKKFRMKIKERILIKFCDKVITVSDSIADEYVKLYKIPKPTVIFNCPVIDHKKKITKQNLYREKFHIPESKKIFLYQGIFSEGRGIEIILRAFSMLDLENTTLIFMGDGPLKEKIKMDKNYNKSVFIYPFVQSNEILKYTSSADFGISFIEDTSLSYRYCMPNKLFEYIAAGLPVISSNLPDMKKFIQKYGVGVSANQNNADGLQQAIVNILKLDLNTLKTNVNRTKKIYNWGTQEKVLLNLYNELELT